METKKTIKIKIEVTEDDINKDYEHRKSHPDRCMLATAMIRRLDLRPVLDSVNVDYDGWLVGGPAGAVQGRWNPQTSKKIQEWDAGIRRDPFEINVTFPADWRKQITGK